MSSRAEKERRSLIKQKLKHQEKKNLLDSVPVLISELENLFDWLDLKLSEDACDDSFKFALKFIQGNQLPENELIEWLKNNGGYCDCEILANVEEQINGK